MDWVTGNYLLRIFIRHARVCVAGNLARSQNGRLNYSLLEIVGFHLSFRLSVFMHTTEAIWNYKQQSSNGLDKRNEI